MCECYQIGGPFIAEDPDCPVHGREAQRESARRDIIIDQLQVAVQHGTPSELYQAALRTLEYLQSL